MYYACSKKLLLFAALKKNKLVIIFALIFIYNSQQASKPTRAKDFAIQNWTYFPRVGILTSFHLQKLKYARFRTISCQEMAKNGYWKAENGCSEHIFLHNVSIFDMEPPLGGVSSDICWKCRRVMGQSFSFYISKNFDKKNLRLRGPLLVARRTPFRYLSRISQKNTFFAITPSFLGLNRNSKVYN